VKKDLATLLIRPTTWALTHNVLYIDSPVGTGTNTEEHVIDNRNTGKLDNGKA
jgi:hypothetical protein